MIYLLWAAVVGLAGVVVWQGFRLASLNDTLDDLFSLFCAQGALNDQVKEKLRLVGQHID